MTKFRPPRTIGRALMRISKRLPDDWADMAEVVDRSESLVRAWGDPNRREQIPLRDAIMLDRAYRDMGGEGAPLFEYYTWRLDAAGALAAADAAQLSLHIVEVIREGGQAHAALVRAARPGASVQDRLEAEREVKEAIEELYRAKLMLAGRSSVSHLIDHEDGPSAEQARDTRPP